ncbi:LuxR C-terminal-related transcriptional regulator [Nocardioides sp. SR21]|uniref:helix-turn-helix transcriptional regulator n=1 Tax=Nocardioides sp. SR21 TaxID=2919501 RepID=UPI001FAAB780|nr:LuxR C-terminal-related transcriptional regulator [Nocardioides sp. SR21]
MFVGDPAVGGRVEEQLKRVTVLDGHGLFTQVIEQVLVRHGYRCRVIEAGALTSEAIVSAVEASRPEMVVASLDLHSRCSDGGAVIHALARAGHRVLAVTEGDGPQRQGKALALGAHAVATKAMPLNEFLSLVRRTMHGVQVVDRRERERVVMSYREQQIGHAVARRQLESLSAQERDILTHLMTGRGVREIAQLRVVSEHTVRAQVRAVRTKLGASSQVEAVAIAWRSGWRTASD